MKPLPRSLLALAVLFATNLSAFGDAPTQGNVTKPDALDTLPGFKVELLRTADPATEGSWISIIKDPMGRLLLGGERKEPISRLTIVDGKVTKAEILKIPLSEVMGMLFAFDSLYVNGRGNTPDGHEVFGLWRCTASKNDDEFDKVELLREWKGGGGDHGAHAILLNPDKKHLNVLCGNFVDVPGDALPTSPHRNYADDLVLPRAEDATGFGAGRKPPGGFVVRMDPDGKNCELVASGERNTYCVAFNHDGELFGFDSDMEGDWGAPWYRPVRVFHVTSGADHGFREGASKWPEYYHDSLPATVTIGIGCPTGVAFGTGAKFPEIPTRFLHSGLDLWPPDGRASYAAGRELRRHLGEFSRTEGAPSESRKIPAKHDRPRDRYRRGHVFHPRRPPHTGRPLPCDL